MSERFTKAYHEQVEKISLSEIFINEYRARLVKSEFSDNASGITNGEAEGIPYINKKFIQTTDLIDSLNDRISLISGNKKGETVSLMPMNCRLKQPAGRNRTLYVIESQPEMRSISVSYDQHNFIEILKSTGHWDEYGYTGMEKKGKPYYEEPWNFVLAFPFCVYVIVLKNNSESLSTFSVYFRNMPLRGLGDMLYRAPLYNIRENQRACLGSGMNYVERDPVLTIENIINHFWNSEYNGDFINNVQAYQEVPIVNNYFTWQHYSKSDPMSIFSVEWKEISTLKKIVDEITVGYEAHESANSPYLFRSMEDIVALFSATRHNDDYYNDEEDEEIREFVYGVANYMSIDGIYLYIEDSFLLKGRRYFITSFVSDNRYSYEPTHLEVLNDKGKKLLMKLTNRVRDSITDSIEKESALLEADLDGLKVKKGDVIKIVTPGGRVMFRRILGMRYNTDGKLEARLANDYYLLDRMQLVEVVDMSEITVYGERINRGDRFLQLHRLGRRHERIRGVYTRFRFMEYVESDLSDNGNITHMFEGYRDHSSRRLNLQNEQIIQGFKRLYREERLKRIPSIIRMGHQIRKAIRYSERQDEFVDAPVYQLNDELMLFGEHHELKALDRDEIIDKCFLNDHQTFLLYGIDGIMCFSVGDKVVIPNWRTPMEMLKTKTITGFDFDSDNEWIFVNVVDKQGNETQVRLLRAWRTSMRRHARVKLNCMYHAKNAHGELTAGMKIKAKQAKISNFPMKDVNIIIAFLPDFGLNEPLVLCSNGCTLWYSDIIEKFDITPFSDPKWKKMKHADIDVSKIRPQPGDLYIKTYSSNDPYVICNQPHGNGLRTCDYDRFFADPVYLYHEAYTTSVRRDSIPFGILGPRYTQSQLMDMERIPGFPTPYGIVYNKRSQIRFPVEGWRIQGYVQRIPE